MLPLIFSNFLRSINTLEFKASVSTFYWFQICQKVARQFEILAILYFYPFIITFNLTLQQELLFIEMNEVRNFYQQMSDFSVTFAFENITKIRYEERRFDHSHLLLAYDIFLKGIFQIESIVSLYF